MMSDEDLTHSVTNMVSETVATPSERRIEHRSILQWGFTHLLQNSGRLGFEVGRTQTYFVPISLINHNDILRYRLSGDHDSIVQWTETASVERSSASAADKTRVQPAREVLLVAGDSSHEEG